MPPAPGKASIEVAVDLEALAHRAASWITDLAAASRDRFAICLSGGSTPRRLYQLLGEAPHRDRLPWDRVHWFWGDERFVPWDNPDSNYRMAHAALFARVSAPAANVHGIATAGTPRTAAVAYEQVLKSYYKSEILHPARPLFDIQILGLGPDGHTASLIPGTSVIEERNRWVAEVMYGRPEPRITLTYPVIESSRHTAFLVAGEDKREALSRTLAGDQALPAARVRPVGDLTWFVDKAAHPSP
jgi:6-phosphogluconolactonase